MGFFGGTPDRFISHDNPYLGQLAGMGYEMGPARKYYKGILKSGAKGDFSAMPGMGMFDNEISKLNDEYDKRSSGMVTGPLADRLKQLAVDRQKNDINSQRYGFAQNQLDSAGRSLADMWAQKNQWNLGKMGALIGGENNRYQYVPGKGSFFGDLIKSGWQAASNAASKAAFA